MRSLGLLVLFVAAILLLGSSLAAQQPSARLPFAVVDTGQTLCYDDAGRMRCPEPGRPFHGQDAQYEGAQPGYRDNGDGTVTDVTTGLSWQKEYARSPFARAEAAAAEARTGGYSDWRVPTIKELYSLMLFSGTTGSGRPESGSVPSDARPYLETKFFAFEYPATGRYIDAQYITSTRYVSTTMDGNPTFFGVNFADGRIKGYPQSGGHGGRDYYLRLVRGNPEYGRNDFADQGDGTVLDRATGMTWLKADSGDPSLLERLRGTSRKDGTMNWEEALKYCETLDYAGRSDWRLPNAKELQSIVDYTRSPRTTGSAALAPVFSATPIRDEGGDRNFASYWTSTTHLDGRRPGDRAVYVAFGEALGFMSLPGGGRQDGPGMGGPGMGPPPGGPGGRPGMGEPGREGVAGMPKGQKKLMDVHGAGAQRSDRKSGDPASEPQGHGPQGDVQRIYNMVRCVAGGAASAR